MIYTETDSNCGGCPEIYKNCAMCEAKEYKIELHSCDACKEEGTDLSLYEYNGKEFCEKCFIKRRIKDMTKDKLLQMLDDFMDELKEYFSIEDYKIV